MKKKKFRNGTEKGSKSEPATRSSSAPSGAAAEVVELDDDALTSVSGGATLSWVFRGDKDLLDLYTGPRDDLCYRASLTFTCARDADVAESALFALEGSEVSAADIIKALKNVGVTATDGYSLRW